MTYPSLYPAEAQALEHAADLDDEQLADELHAHHELAQAGYSDADGLRQLASLSLVRARRLDVRSSARADELERA
jgi:hypothetical protein